MVRRKKTTNDDPWGFKEAIRILNTKTGREALLEDLRKCREEAKIRAKKRVPTEEQLKRRFNI